jgi:hypothetical protein
MKDRFWVVVFLFFDFLTALIAWSSFFYLRQTVLEKSEFKLDSNFIYGVLLIPLVWVLFYYVQGTYISDVSFKNAKSDLNCIIFWGNSDIFYLTSR